MERDVLPSRTRAASPNRLKIHHFSSDAESDQRRRNRRAIHANKSAADSCKEKRASSRLPLVLRNPSPPRQICFLDNANFGTQSNRQFLSASSSRMRMISSQVVVSVNAWWTTLAFAPPNSVRLFKSEMGSALCIAPLCPNQRAYASRDGVFFW